MLKYPGKISQPVCEGNVMILCHPNQLTHEVQPLCSFATPKPLNCYCKAINTKDKDYLRKIQTNVVL